MASIRSLEEGSVLPPTAATASADDDPAEVAGVAADEDLLLLLASLLASLLALEVIEFITSAAALRLLVLDPPALVLDDVQR